MREKVIKGEGREVSPGAGVWLNNRSTLCRWGCLGAHQSVRANVGVGVVSGDGAGPVSGAVLGSLRELARGECSPGGRLAPSIPVILPRVGGWFHPCRG